MLSSNPIYLNPYCFDNFARVFKSFLVKRYLPESHLSIISLNIFLAFSYSILFLITSLLSITSENTDLLSISSISSNAS